MAYEEPPLASPAHVPDLSHVETPEESKAAYAPMAPRSTLPALSTTYFAETLPVPDLSRPGSIVASPKRRRTCFARPPSTRTSHLTSKDPSDAGWNVAVTVAQPRGAILPTRGWREKCATRANSNLAETSEAFSSVSRALCACLTRHEPKRSVFGVHRIAEDGAARPVSATSSAAVTWSSLAPWMEMDARWP